MPSRNWPASRHAGKTNQQLIKELTLLEDSLDAMPDAVAAFDADDRLVFFNTAYRDLYSSVSPKWLPGMSYRDMVGILLDHVAPADARGREEEWIEERTARHQHHQPPQDRHYESGRIIRISHHPTASDGSIDIRADVTELRQSQRDERRLQIRLEALMDAMPMPMFFKAPDGRFLGCNQAFQRFLGKSSSDIIGHRITDLISSEMALWHEQNDTALFAAGGSDVSESFARSGQGTKRDVIFYKSVFDAGDELACMVGVMIDITEMREFERALRQSEARWSTLFQQSPNPMILTGWGGAEILEVNDAWCAIWGHKRSAVVGKQTADIEIWRDISDRKPFDEELSRRGLVDGFEAKFLTKDGKSRIARIDARKVVLGGVEQLLSVVADVTERNAAAAAIERFVSALEFIPQGIALWDSEQRLVHHNERYREILEPAGQEMVPGSSIEDLHREIAASGIMEASIGREEAWVADHMREYQKADDDRRFQRLGRWHQRIYRRLPVGGLIFLVDDIHDTITAEEQLHQAQKMEAVGQLTGDIAHDFNNILAVMLGHLELAVDGLPESSKSVPMLDKAIAAAHRGAELVHRLLAFSANQALIPEIIDINKRLASMVEMMRRVFDETIEIIIKEAPEQLFCKVDPGQMETALLNLAINARDAMPDGGSLTVAVSETGLAVDDTDMAAGSYVTLTVSDTGTGMTDSVLSRVFEPFYTTKGQGKGTGLGLSMVYGFVKQSAGHITVHSEVGEGTRFKIHLPLCEASDGTSQTDIATEAHLRASESILLVEDDAALLDMASQLLQSLGYKVHVASDGPAACDVLDSGVRIDLLLTDVVLPKGMTGPDVAARAQKQYPDIKVLYMSGYNEHPILSSGAGHTMTLISKPFRKVQLANEVRLALGHGT